MNVVRKLAAIVCLALMGDECAGAVTADVINISLAVADFDDPIGQVVADPAAASSKALAVNLAAKERAYAFRAAPKQLEPGCYRATFYVRLRHKPQANLSRLQLNLTTQFDKDLNHTQHWSWVQFDSTPDRYTPLAVEWTVPRACDPKFQLTWLQVNPGVNARAPSLHEVNPTMAELDAALDQPKLLPGSDDLVAEIKTADTGAALESLDYPVVLFDRVTLEPLSNTQWIAAVRPQFLHVYPDGANPIEVELHNEQDRPVAAVAKLEIRAGLDETLHTASAQVNLPPHSTTKHRWDWIAGSREFGHEARVSLAVDGQVVDARSEYFSVSDVIWKTALQASGFLAWHGREKELPGHVAYNREHYLNVEEAFSWQPSSWTDLNPTTSDWWSGQGNAHNSKAGLKQWIGLSHEQGIKMITYLWPTASGPVGLEWARQNPELIIFDGGNFDVEDLRLKSAIEANPRWWRVTGGVWNHVYVNRGLLRSIEKGVAETIASSQAFGWDGCRFDKPPGWGRMPAETMHAEFKELQVEKLMQRLVPEYYGQTTGVWDGEAVSVTNLRYARHRFHEHDPHFAISYNGAVGNRGEGATAALDEMAKGGGQGMNESMRLMIASPWRNYLSKAREEADLAHARGGFHTVVRPDGFGTALSLYSGVAVLIAGSHPYGDFGWSAPLPGKYTQFATRYGEYFWSQDLRSTTAEAAGFSAVGDDSIWWRDLPKHRRTTNGSDQWVVHLLSKPPTDTLTALKPGTITPWQRGLVVGRQTDREPTVWALTAEPSTRAECLPARREGDRYVVEIPEHRVWTMLVWTEAQK